MDLLRQLNATISQSAVPIAASARRGREQCLRTWRRWALLLMQVAYASCHAGVVARLDEKAREENRMKDARAGIPTPTSVQPCPKKAATKVAFIVTGKGNRLPPSESVAKKATHAFDSCPHQITQCRGNKYSQWITCLQCAARWIREGPHGEQTAAALEVSGVTQAPCCRECGQTTVLRQCPSGTLWWGCSKYPHCWAATRAPPTASTQPTVSAAANSGPVTPRISTRGTREQRRSPSPGRTRILPTAKVAIVRPASQRVASSSSAAPPSPQWNVIHSPTSDAESEAVSSLDPEITDMTADRLVSVEEESAQQAIQRIDYLVAAGVSEEQAIQDMLQTLSNVTELTTVMRVLRNRPRRAP